MRFSVPEKTAWKSAAVSSRRALVNDAVGATPMATQATQAVRRLRPLARRRFSTSRPLAVAMRALNPWVRLRLILLGWKVRFMVLLAPVAAAATRCASRRGVDSKEISLQVQCHDLPSTPARFKCVAASGSPCGYERPWFGHGKLGVTCAHLPKPRTARLDGRKVSDLLTIDSQLAGPADAV